MEEYTVNVPVGLQNDEREISKVLKENKYSKLESVKLKKNELVLTFSKSTEKIIHPKRVMQVSRKRFPNFRDMSAHIGHILGNERGGANYIYTLKESKTWTYALEPICLKDKWLVFFVG